MPAATAPSNLLQHRLANGLMLVAESIPGTQSLAMTLLLPAGVAAEPEPRQGVGTLLSEMMCRGAGGLSAREHSDALDRLGVQRDTGVQTHHLRLGATMIGSKLPEALPLLLSMATDPTLADDTFEPSRDLALQDLDSLDDEPQQRATLELRRRHDPPPLGRSPMGRREDLEAASAKDVRAFRDTRFVPGGSILGFAGRFDEDDLIRLVEELTAQWTGTAEEAAVAGEPARGYEPIEAESTQVHIALAYDAVPETDERSVLQRLASAVLSGGMSGRLFTEVREKRGLCYSVYATYAGRRDRGSMIAYAGTTTPRAQETLDVLVAELRRVSDGVAADEFARARVGMKARLVMQGESTSARAAAIAADQYVYGRPRTLDELAARVEAVTLSELNGFVSEHPPMEMTLVTVGPAALTQS